MIVNKFNVFPSGLVSLLQSLSEDMWLEVPLAKIKNHPAPTLHFIQILSPCPWMFSILNQRSLILKSHFHYHHQLQLK